MFLLLEWQAQMKPLYRVPLMAEIASIPWNGYNVVSTFSGCGGSCLGYRMAGFRVLWASEFIEAAQETYRANHPTSHLDTRDIRTVRAEDILQATGLEPGQLDLLDGSPPCASFSTSGSREKGWGTVKKYSDKSQRTDDLFFEYARILRGLQPKVFVAENVSGLIKGTAKGYFLEILAELKSCGYRVKAKLLDAQWLGVPQQRERLIFVGVREDMGLEPVHPDPLGYRYTVREVLPWVQAVKWSGAPNNWRTSDSPSPTIIASGANISPTAYLSGGSYIRAEDVDLEQIFVGFNINYKQVWKPAGSTPAPTIKTAGEPRAEGLKVGQVERLFTIPELRRICAFPDDFILTGNFSQQWERMGRAVPPVMMMHIASTIKEEVLCKIK